MAKTVCFDLDGTLCSNTFGDYGAAEPFWWAIARVNALADAGNRIVISTARGSATGIDWSGRTRAQLERWGVRYDEIAFGKPSADVYVDDRAVHADAWRAGDGFAAPGFGSAGNGGGEALPAVLPPHASCIVETGRTFGGRPLRLMDHVRRAHAVAAAAGLRTAEDPFALTSRVRADLLSRRHDFGGDVVYAVSLAEPPSVAHLDLAGIDPHPCVSVACRPLREVARALAPVVWPDRGEARLRVESCAEAGRPAGAWPLRRAPDGSVVDGLGCQLGVVRRGALRLQAPAGPAPVASAWLRSAAATAGVALEDGALGDDDLAGADEVLVAGLPFCLLRVAEIDGRPVAGGATGPVTARLQGAWSAEVGVDLVAQTAELVHGATGVAVPAP
ncbi:MAG: D-sedoheptulose 7-phosphate isomerase [Solirubrobacteraceae bacterium]|jgi:hypothetical protein|nr:D-sedoheptulose 7-phosphate isomerase [Solirubrobacteraceae bacterium]